MDERIKNLHPLYSPPQRRSYEIDRAMAPHRHPFVASASFTQQQGEVVWHKKVASRRKTHANLDVSSAKPGVRTLLETEGSIVRLDDYPDPCLKCCSERIACYGYLGVVVSCVHVRASKLDGLPTPQFGVCGFSHRRLSSQDDNVCLHL